MWRWSSCGEEVSHDAHTLCIPYLYVGVDKRHQGDSRKKTIHTKRNEQKLRAHRRTTWHPPPTSLIESKKAYKFDIFERDDNIWSQFATMRWWWRRGGKHKRNTHSHIYTEHYTGKKKVQSYPTHIVCELRVDSYCVCTKCEGFAAAQYRIYSVRLVWDILRIISATTDYLTYIKRILTSGHQQANRLLVASRS